MIMRTAPAALLTALMALMAPGASAAPGESAAPGASAAPGESAAPGAADAEEAPAPATLDSGVGEVAFYAFCPRPVSLCSGGVSLGIQRTSLVFLSAPGLGITADGAARFGLGGGIEGKRDDDEDGQDKMGHLLFDLHVGVGPGVRLGSLDLMTAAGLGAGAWAHTGLGTPTGDGDSEAEIFWYATATARVRLSAAVAIQLSGERKYPSTGLGDFYEQRIEAGVLWLANGGKYTLSAFHADHGTFATAGLLLGKSLW